MVVWDVNQLLEMREMYGRFGILVLLVCTGVVACSPKGKYEPKRPAGLPASAIYAGGLDGGDWASCQVTEDNAIKCILYDQTDGQPRYERSFRLCPRVALMRKTGRPVQPRWFDAEGGAFDNVAAFVDRPDKYLPRTSDSPNEIKHQADLAQKYYAEAGVSVDCRPVNKEGS